MVEADVVDLAADIEVGLVEVDLQNTVALPGFAREVQP